MLFKFRTYVSATGRTEVQDIVNNLDPVVVELFLGRIRYLANTEKLAWHEPEAKKLQGVKEIYEIRFKAENVQYRPLGVFGPSDGDFTIRIRSNKKQNVYKPANAIKTSDKRRKLIIDGQATCHPLEIDGEEFPPPEE
jgi:hypothetical protein